MNQHTIYVGIDVDDIRYHGSALIPSTGEMLDFDCRPTLKGLAGQLEKVRGGFGVVQMKLCYRASYVGFSLQRDLNATSSLATSLPLSTMYPVAWNSCWQSTMWNCSTWNRTQRK